MSRRPTLTLAIIALDEERNLAALLPTLGWADEVVVIDGGSRDQTIAIAARHGCRTFSRRFDHFAAQRNYALEVARGDWVLMLDADERPTSRMIREMQRRAGRESSAAYRMPIRSRIFQRAMRYAGTQDDQPIRLVRRDRTRWIGEVHEVCQVRGRVGRLESGVEHHTLPDAAAFLDKMHRYTRLAASARVRRGEPPHRGENWIAPLRELFRRLIWKLGILDGPAGWAFCGLSALSAWVLTQEHCRQWSERQASNAIAERAIPRLFASGGVA